MTSVSRKRWLLAVLAGSVASVPVLAHHSPALFDLSKVVTLNATVTKFEWMNPHVFIHIEVIGEGGATESGQVEADGASPLIPRGWSSSSLKPGDRITLEANPANNPARRMLLGRSITKEDGTVLAPRSVLTASTPSASAAEWLAGVWLPRGEGFAEFASQTNSHEWSLTPSAERERDAYDGVSTPQVDCVPVSAPTIMLQPVHTEIVVSGDRILIRRDWMDVERVVYMDGRGHPENGERTVQGHTIGRWDDDTLVMDTALFKEHILGTNGRVPSGLRKHLVERLSLTADRRSLTYEFTLDDPEYLLEPVTGNASWDFRPDLKPSGLPCNLDAARRPLYAEILDPSAGPVTRREPGNFYVPMAGSGLLLAVVGALLWLLARRRHRASDKTH
jgi:hypothetical protein